MISMRENKIRYEKKKKERKKETNYIDLDRA